MKRSTDVVLGHDVLIDDVPDTVPAGTPVRLRTAFEHLGEGEGQGDPLRFYVDLQVGERWVEPTDTSYATMVDADEPEEDIAWALEQVHGAMVAAAGSADDSALRTAAALMSHQGTDRTRRAGPRP